MQPTNTLAPAEPATPTLEPTATATLEPTEEPWQVYVNTLYGYQISFPPDAQYLEHGVEGFPADDLPENMTNAEYEEYLMELLGDNICLEIQYQTGYVSISAPTNDGYQYAICGPTGVGLGNITARNEPVKIGGEQYIANGREYVSEDGTEHDETLSLILPDKTRITFGQGVDDPEMYDDYRENVLPVLLEIVETFDDSPAGTFDWEAYEEGGPVEEQEGLDKVAFEEDVTIPDGTRMEPGEVFTKTWRLRNDGETTWNKHFDLVFDSGEQMGGPDRQALTEEVPPGESIDISVKLTAPEEEGEYTGLWILEDEVGNPFGTGTEAQSAFWLAIVVEDTGEDGQENGEEGDNNGETEGLRVTAATLTVDQNNYSGACAVDLTFSGVIASEGAGSFTYEFQAGANNSGFEFSLPGPQQVTHGDDGSHQLSITFTLTIESSVDGWAQLVISEPNDFSSNLVNFTVECTE